jgi:hypothetical protein
MLTKFGSHLTYANLMATIAVFAALGGSGYAAVTINGKQLKNRSVAGKKLKNRSVTGKKLKNRTITQGKIKKKTLTGAEVRDFSLLANSFKPGQLPKGPKGDTGARGPQGSAGTTDVFISAGGPGSTQAFCESDEVAVGGGGISSDGFLYQSQPLPFQVDVPATGWQAGAKKADGTAADVSTWVVCAAP